jgi:hypothetical protein
MVAPLQTLYRSKWFVAKPQNPQVLRMLQLIFKSENYSFAKESSPDKI